MNYAFTSFLLICQQCIFFLSAGSGQKCNNRAHQLMYKTANICSTKVDSIYDGKIHEIIISRKRTSNLKLLYNTTHQLIRFNNHTDCMWLSCCMGLWSFIK